MSGLTSLAFLPVRKLIGPLHRRRRQMTSDQNDTFSALSAPFADDRWFRGGFAPREHNDLALLVHGDEYFRDLHATLLSARERVTICGWCLTPLMPLQRGNREKEAASVFAEVLRDVSERVDVYVLLWCGAPIVFEPTQESVKQAVETLKRIAPRVQCAIDHAAPFSHDQHQKAVTVDGDVAYVGGMDISTFQGDRWDTSEHRLRFGPNWHDVQVRIRGEAVDDVQSNFCQRWNATVGWNELEPLKRTTADRSWTTPAQIVRTIPTGFYPFAPDGEYGIYHVLIAAIRRAERYIYLENQYLWAPEIVDELRDAINRPRSDRFRVVIVLPAKAYSGKYDNDEHVRALADADGGRGIFSAYSLYAGGPAIGNSGFRYLPIYVHAKVSIVDDEWFSVGSANLNGRGIATDAEMNVHGIDPDVARHLRIRLWSEHLGISEEQVAIADPCDLLDSAWKDAARQMETAITSMTLPPACMVRTYIPGQNVGSRALDLIQAATLEH